MLKIYFFLFALLISCSSFGFTCNSIDSNKCSFDTIQYNINKKNRLQNLTFSNSGIEIVQQQDGYWKFIQKNVQLLVSPKGNIDLAIINKDTIKQFFDLLLTHQNKIHDTIQIKSKYFYIDNEFSNFRTIVYDNVSVYYIIDGHGVQIESIFQKDSCLNKERQIKLTFVNGKIKLISSITDQRLINPWRYVYGVPDYWRVNLNFRMILNRKGKLRAAYYKNTENKLVKAAKALSATVVTYE